MTNAPSIARRDLMEPFALPAGWVSAALFVGDHLLSIFLVPGLMVFGGVTVWWRRRLIR